MAQARAQARQEEEQRELDSKKTQIEEKLSRAAENRVDLSEKAKAHNAKVQEKVSIALSTEQEAAGSRLARMEAKLSEAASRREDKIEQVKTTAAQSAIPRGAASSMSPSKQT